MSIAVYKFLLFKMKYIIDEVSLFDHWHTDA